jgi:hypothetical protein
VAAPPLKSGDEITEGVLYRRIPPIADYWVVDEGRPSSLNFRPDTGEPYVSMDLKDPDEPEAQQIKRVLATEGAIAGSGLVEIDVAVLRELRLKVTYEPEYGERHFGVAGWEQMTTKDAIRARKKLTMRTRVVEKPKMPPPAPP